METYLDILPGDINSVIFSKLDYDDVLNINDTYDINYKALLILRHPDLYRRIMGVVNLNIKLKFKNFKKYLPISWKILYLDILTLDESVWIEEYLLWKPSIEGKLNLFTIDIFNLIYLNKVYHNFYKYMDAYLEYPGGIKYIKGVISERYMNEFSVPIQTLISDLFVTGVVNGILRLPDSGMQIGSAYWSEEKILLNILYVAIKYNFGDRIHVTDEFIEKFVNTMYGLENPVGSDCHVYGEYKQYEGIYDGIISYVSRNINKLTILIEM